MEKQIFIIGTSTDCGKTWFGLQLVEEGYHVIKPIETGKESFKSIEESDSGQYAELQGLKIEDVNLYFFDKSCSPHLACEIDDKKIDIEKLKKFIVDSHAEYVELAGGLMVPITRDYNQLDLIKELDGEVMLIVKNELGAINHTLLTIDVLRRRRIPIVQIVYNDFGKESYITKDNQKIILEELRKDA